MTTMTPGEMMVWAATYAQKFLERPVDGRRLALQGVLVPWLEMNAAEGAAVAAAEWAWSAVHELRRSGEAVKELFGDEVQIFFLQMTVMGQDMMPRESESGACRGCGTDCGGMCPLCRGD